MGPAELTFLEGSTLGGGDFRVDVDLAVVTSFAVTEPPAE